MEKLLFGIIYSEKPLSLKKKFAAQIAGAGKNQNIEYGAFSKMLIECMQHMYGEKMNLDKDSEGLVRNVVRSWILNMKMTERYLEEKLSVETYKTLTSKHKIALLNELLFIMRNLSETKHRIPNIQNFQLFYYDAFMCVSDLREFSLICCTYIEYPFLLLKELSPNAVQNVGAVFVKVLSDTPISDYIVYEKQEKENLQYVFKLLSVLVEKSRNFVNIIATNLFKVLMDDTSTQPSICISKYLNFLNIDDVSVYLNQAIQSKLSEDQLVLMTCRMLDWICFPDIKLAIDQWVLQVFKYLLLQKKYQILSTVIEGKIIQIFNLIYFPVYRSKALSLMTFMLISYLHSPKPFHAIAVSIPDLLSRLISETSSDKQTAKVIGELTYTLMYHYPGFPDIYEKLLISLQSFEKPSENQMKIWLKSSSTISQTVLPDFVVPHREPGTKVGLDNLGNTCYANSVIQALFNLKSLRKMLLEKDLNTIHSLTQSVQELFGLLLLTKRSSLAPRIFLQHSRPPWFQVGFQQDCSEYLKYLLDKLQTESIQHNEDVNSFLSGIVKTSVECCNCGFFSSQEEVFNDIPLSFTQENILGEKPHQTLKGGDSSDLKRKIGCKLSEASDPKQTITDDEVVDLTSSRISSYTDQMKIFTIQDMLASHLCPELLKDANKYYCETCLSLQDAKKHMDIIKFPKYLILTMKRFTYNVTTQKRSKLLHIVNHPQFFTFCDLCSKCHDETETLNEESIPSSSSQIILEKHKCNKNNQNYFRLLSVIVHSGHSSDSGHYYAYTCEYLFDGTYKWCLLNDSRVTSASDDCISKLSSRFPQDTPYVCIYECYEPEQNPINEMLDTQGAISDFVNNDNAAYERELRQDFLRKKKRIFTSNNYFDDNDQNGGNGPCGGGGGGGFGGGRIVF